MKPAQILTRLAQKVGVNTTEKEFENFLTGAVELSDEDGKKFNNLFTAEDAKQNLELKRYFYAGALDHVDKKLVKLMTELGFSEEDKAPIIAEPDTFKRFDLFTLKSQEIVEKKLEGTGKKKDDLTGEINKLQQEKAALTKGHELALKEKDQATNDKITKMAMRQILSGKKTIYDNLPVTAKLAALEAVLKERLIAAEAQIVLNEDQITLRQAKDTSLDWYDKKTNEKLSFEQFADGVLAADKILAVNNPAGTHPDPNGNGNPPGTFKASPIPGTGADAFNQSVVSSMDEDLARLEAAPK